MKLLLLILFLSTSTVFAHDVALVTQHVAIRKQSISAWQQDVLARAVVSPVLDLGLQATYLERFDFHENRYGGFLIYHPSTALTVEGRYLRGERENEILPKDEYNISAYYALAPGFTPFLIYRDVDYSITELHTLNLGLEIEKIRHFIIVPQVMFGSATFERPSETKNVHNVGLRIMYYREQDYSLFIFGSKGEEASQAIIGRRSILVSTLTGGAGAGYFVTPALRAELLVDHTDYEEINNQFLTTTLQLRWIF